MNVLFRRALSRLALLVVLGLLLGREINNLWLGLGLALSVYTSIFLYHYRRFQQWLDTDTIGLKQRKPLLNAFWLGIADQIERIVTRLREQASALETEVEFFKDSFQALDSAVIILNEKGEIDWANSAALPMLGIDFAQDRGQLLVNLLRSPLFIQYLNQRVFDTPLVMDSVRYSEKKIEVRATPFRSDYVLVLVRDISELAKLENVRQDFIANVSHELRTPLTVITGYLETLKDNADQLPVFWSQTFEQMLLQSNRMDNMVNDLLWLSRLESLPESEHPDIVPIEALVQGIVADASVAAPDKSISFAIADELKAEAGNNETICLSGSYDELRSAFSNLIQNAVKYTADEGKIEVSCYRTGNTVRVKVSDNGEGIDPIHIPRLTERFYRTDTSRTSDTGGTGLGLAIVKHVLSRHDAKLEIVSKPGKGSQFSCVFPATRITTAAI